MSGAFPPRAASETTTSIEFEHFIGTNVVPNGVSFHPDEKHYVISSGGNILVGDLMNPQYQEFLRKHDDQVTCLTLSNSGNLIASGQKGENSNVYVWDYTTLSLRYAFEEHDNGIECLAFTHDEKILVSVGNRDDRKIIIWDMSNGCIIASANRIPDETRCLAHGGFVKDIKRRDTTHYLMCTGGKEGLLLWNLDPYSGDFECKPVMGDPRGTVKRYFVACVFSEDRDLLFGATASGDYIICNVRNAKMMQAIEATKMGLLCILANRDFVIVGCGDDTVKLYDHTGRYLRESKVDGQVCGLSLSRDQRELLALTSHGTIARVNVASCQHIIISESHTKSVVAVAYAAGHSDRFATASADGTIRVWDAAEYAVLVVAVARREMDRVLGARGAHPLCLAYSDILYSGWTDGRVLAHSAETGESLWFIENAHPGGVTALALSHNRRFIVTGGAQGEVRLWELRSRDLVSHLKEHGQRVNSVVLFDDDSTAVSASRDRSVLRWDLKLERRVFCHQQRMGGINCVALSKDQRYVLSVGQEKKLVYWDMQQNDPVRQFFLDGEADEGRAVAISHSGKWVATGGTAGTLRVWSFATGELMHASDGHNGIITQIVFSPDDKQIVSVAENGSIILWCVFDKDSTAERDGQGPGTRDGGSGRK